MQDKTTDLISGDNSIFAPKMVNERLAKMVSTFGMPEWILDGGQRKCLECGKTLGVTSVREVGLCLNAQNIGDVQVEILCRECWSGYYLYFRKACGDFEEFGQMMAPSHPHFRPVGPVVPGKQLKAQDNNLTDVMVEEQGACKDAKGEQCP